jgi:hypothetical protein
MGRLGSPAVRTHGDKVLTFNAHHVSFSDKESVANPCSEVCQARMDPNKKEFIFSRKKEVIFRSRKKEVIFSRETDKGVATTQEGEAPSNRVTTVSGGLRAEAEEAYGPTHLSSRQCHGGQRQR